MSFDNTNVDVYESEDLPESDRNVFTHEEINDPNHIELIHIDFEAAKERFKGRTLNVKEVDFSDSIAHKRRHAYGSAAYVLEVVGSAYSEPETPEQKFNRLTYEINELSDMLKDKTDNANSLLTSANCALLLEELNGVRVGNDGSSAAPVTSYDASTIKNNVDCPSASVLSLENRLRRIESIVGTLPTSNTSLVDSLEDLKFRTDALNPVYLEGLETRLNKILTTLEQVESKSEANVDGAIEAKVNSLLTMMEKWDAVCVNLPSNVKKIQSLHKLHEQSQHFSDRLSQLVGIRDQVEKAISRDKDEMRDLQLKTKEDVAAIGKQIASLEKRLESIGK